MFNNRKHISVQFNNELEALRQKVMKMGGLVEQQLLDSLHALETKDDGLAKHVLNTDQVVNDLEIEIDEDCTAIIARRQPAASDLRLVLSIIKTVAELERIGDEIERVAKVTLSTTDKLPKEIVATISLLGRHVLRVLRDTLDAFARMDAEAAFRLHKEDVQVDKEYKALSELIVTMAGENRQLLEQLVDVLWSTRALERIGDRCQNISELIIYFVSGNNVRHVSRKLIAKQLGHKPIKSSLS